MVRADSHLRMLPRVPFGVAAARDADADPTIGEEKERVATPTLQDLLDAGTHFGHQTRRWNPKMRRFIFAERSGIYLIDLQKTLKQLMIAVDLLKQVALKGENILFVCTKRQLKAVVETEARNAGCHYVTERWLGGTLTN
ncbi:MAG: 30S ribosomal protein S2, partial [Gemmatimonadales bacterium]